MNKYKIYCETHGWVDVIGENDPTKCPINQSDTVKNESVHLISHEVLVNDGTPLDVELSLEGYKILRYNEIDGKTMAIIAQGFTFDSKLFSLSVPAQSNWTNIKSNKATFSALGSFPVQISTKDNNTYYLEEIDVDAFWGAGMTAVKTAYNRGADLKKLIFDATTKIEVDAVIDNR